MQTLLLRIKGMQSWGDTSYVHRHTRNEPTFSGIMGLIGSAMNIRTNTLEFEPFSKLKMSIRVEKEGCKQVDYQNASHFKTLANSPRKKGKENEQTWRYYMSDADFIVALTGKKETIEQVAKAIKHPKYHICFGRLCFTPSYPLFAGVYEGDNPLETLKNINVLYGEKLKKGLTRFVYESDEITMSSEEVKDGIGHKTRVIQSKWFNVGEENVSV